MKTIIKIAWRNLWRNKKRTLITMASIFVAIILALFMRSMQFGTYDNMIDSAVKLSTGYLQIHKNGYWDDKSINKTFYNTDSIPRIVNNIESVTISAPRVESFALASSGEKSKGIMVIGTDPEIENSLTSLKEKMIAGEYLSEGDNKILVAEKLAEFLGLNVNDTLVLLGQGYHGVSAAGKFTVKGIFKYPVPEMNNKLIYMSLNEAGYFYAAPQMLTSYTIMIANIGNLEEVRNKLENSLNNQYEVMSWDEMNKEIVQSIEGDNAGGIIMLAILYIVVGFGVFGTMMMMTMERKKEFAVMIAVGLQKGKLATIVFWETIFIGIVSIISGLIFTFPILLYLYYNPFQLTGDVAKSFETFGVEPIMPFSLSPDIFISQAYTVMLITIIAVLYPLFIIARFNVIKGMRT